MSGHNKWSQIKYKKAVTDARRGRLYSKISAQISLAAKKGAEPDLNSELRQVIDKAQKAGMTRENIEKAIKRGTGQTGRQLEELTYEAYGPVGLALIISVITDNRNRTVSDIKSVLGKAGGKLAEAGSVGYLFEQRGMLRLTPAGDELQLAAIEAGAEDLTVDDGALIIYCQPQSLGHLKDELINEAGAKIEIAETILLPRQTIELPAHEQQKAIDLLERLEDLTDVQKVEANLG